MDREAASAHDLLEGILLDENKHPIAFPLWLLESITDNFSDDFNIGSGGFADVYKGQLKSGIVAVKKFKELSGKVEGLVLHEKMFMQEVDCLVKVKHKNIVRFLGYCYGTHGELLKHMGKNIMAEKQQRFLCFEFLPQGSLDKYISDALNGLEWRKRFHIIKGICEGLNYLHGKRIVHLDLKPQNILLDDNMVPKIGDFGLARSFLEEDTSIKTQNVFGTFCYMAPETLRRTISLKSDIYSLGVIIIEMLTGQKNDNLSVENVRENWIARFKTSHEGRWLEHVTVCTKIGLDCMQLDLKKRPTIGQIIDRLDELEEHKYGFSGTGLPFPATHTQMDIVHRAEQIDEEIVRFRTAFQDDEKPATTPNSNGVAGSKQGLVNMMIAKYSKKDVALTADSVTAVLEIAAASSAAVRDGLDLVVVVDVSVSMEGHKMESVKRALQFIIMKLTPVDRLSIVTFASDAQRLTNLRPTTQAAQADLTKIVASLVAQGATTDIKAGLEMGLAILADRVFTEARTANIFLMSHGWPNGATAGDPRHVDPGEVSVHTFGYGDGTNHKLLLDIALQYPGGTYSTVPDGANLSAPFERLLGGLLTVVAQDVRLTLTPRTADGDLYTMVVAPGTDYTLTTDASGVITIKFGTLFSGETRKVSVNFTLKESPYTEVYNATLAVARHSYAAQETLQLPQKIQRVRKPEASLPNGDGVEERSVQAEQERLQHGGLISQASELADGRKLDDARAKILEAQNALEDIMLDEGGRMQLPQNIQRMRKPKPSLPNGDGVEERLVQAKQVHLQHAGLISQASELADGRKLDDARAKIWDAANALEDIMLDEGGRMVNVLQAELLRMLKYMESQQLYDKLGRPYATITSHAHQRAAGRGDEEAISLYDTPRMIACLEQAKKFKENPEATVPSADEDVN